MTLLDGQILLEIALFGEATALTINSSRAVLLLPNKDRMAAGAKLVGIFLRGIGFFSPKCTWMTYATIAKDLVKHVPLERSSTFVPPKEYI